MYCNLQLLVSIPKDNEFLVPTPELQDFGIQTCCWCAANQSTLHLECIVYLNFIAPCLVFHSWLYSRCDVHVLLTSAIVRLTKLGLKGDPTQTLAAVRLAVKPAIKFFELNLMVYNCRWSCVHHLLSLSFLSCLSIPVCGLDGSYTANNG